MRAFVFAAGAAFLAACGPSVPAHPTWFQDVQPLLQANCGRCHGPDPQDTSIAGFRLDRYVAGDDQTQDAWDYRQAIIDHAAANRPAAPVMPPTYPLSDRQKAILKQWVADGAPKGERDNTPPHAELFDASVIPTSVDQSLDLTVRSWDDDGDGLWVQLFAREVGQANETPLSKRFGQGIRSATADTGVLPSGRTYEVFAVVDDGYSDEPWQNRLDLTLIPALVVDHGAKGTAPLVQLVQPNGGNTLLGTVTIAWAASDPDPGDTLSIDLDLYTQDTTGWVKVETIGSGLPNGPQSVQWTPDVPSTTAQNAPIAYKIRVTATDTAGNIRFDESDTPFTVAPPPKTTTFTWADMKPLFNTYCLQCHAALPSIPANDYFRLDKYDAADPVPPVDSDEGAYEVRDLIYQKVVLDKSMPPPSATSKPTSQQRSDIGDWILGGAPKGGGPVNAPPAVTWSTPNDSAISLTTNGRITLQWTAVDPEGQPITGPVSVVQIFARQDALASCSASLVGWAPLSGVSAADGTAVFIKPACTPTPGNSCYWCFKVDASDGVGTTVKAAARPVK